jgi:PilZ domain
MDERRRVPRVAVDTQTAQVLTNVDVQVLDISVAGVLLHTTQAVEPGSRGCLRLNLWGSPFAVDVEVRRVKPWVDGERTSGYGVGAVFVGMLPEYRHLIERFASQ